jgi:transcriptional regulator with XRE-family HTH domain
MAGESPRRIRVAEHFLVPDLIRLAREAAGLSRQELAETIGVGLRTIERLEGGERPPKPMELLAIAHATGNEPDVLAAELDDIGGSTNRGVLPLGSGAVNQPPEG